MSVDCLILGFYDYPFTDYVTMLRSMGTDSGAYHDLSLAFVEHEGEPMRALDVLTRFHFEDRPLPARPFHNADFLWPAVYYLTTYLRRRGYEIDYVNLPHLEMDNLGEKLKRGVSTVAITTTLYVSPQPIVALVSAIREYDQDVRIVVGGPYISNLTDASSPEELSQLFEYLGADVYVLSKEGEETLAQLLAAVRSGSSLLRVPNLAFRNTDDSFTFTQHASESNALDENIIDFTAFGREEMGEFLSLRTAKSCPFACAFCGFPGRAGEYRFLDVSGVEKQLDIVAQLGTITTLTFLDDTFNVPKARFKDILRMMIRNDYGFRWNCFYRADQGDQETIELMAQAGCEGVFLGVESGSDVMLKLMNKTARKKHYVQAIPLLKANGISTYASLIVGYPGETGETVAETINFIAAARPDFYRAQLWYADPVTPIWKRREEFGITGAGFNWTHNTMTARQACAWIDRIFMEVEDSVWLPQFGFEQWSTFYLARKGMSWRQIKTFLTSFNDLIRHRMKPANESDAAELWENLRRSCQFDRAATAAAVNTKINVDSLIPDEDNRRTISPEPLSSI